MSNVIYVRLTENDHFVVTDPDTGIEHVYNSSIFHDPRFIVDLSVKNFFCEAFPGKTECDCSAEALERMQSITEFNCLSDEIRI